MEIKIDLNKIQDELTTMIQVIIREELQHHFGQIKEFLPEKFDQLLTIPQAAKFAKVSTKSIHNWKKEGLQSSHGRIAQSELIRYINSKPAILKEFRKRNSIKININT